MAAETVTNRFGNIVSHPNVIVDANSVDDIIAVMKDPQYDPQGRLLNPYFRELLS
jgi:hypothetical protein